MNRAKTLLAKALTLPLAASMALGSVPVSANAAQISGAAAENSLDTSYIFANLGAQNMADSALSFDGSNFGKATANGNNVTFSGTAINAGNGNGFKMGGSGMSGKHTLQNSVAYENKAKGIDSNSGPDIKVYNSVSYNNGSYNLALYSNKNVKTDFVADGIISYRSPIAGNDNIMSISEKIELYNQEDTITSSSNNYLWDKDSQTSKNGTGETATDAWFKNLDTQKEPTRNADGSINRNDLLVLTEQASPSIKAAAAPSESMETDAASEDAITPEVTEKLATAEGELEGWEFAYFGTSAKPELNTKIQGIAAGTDLSADNNGAVVKLTSCTSKEDGKIDQKGGKFTFDGYDGLSYYYTTLDATTENFYLEATVTVDYINPSPDGQDGFALLARDSIGENGVAGSAFYSNSMAAIGTKLSYTDTEGAVHQNVKDIVGYRTFEGITDAASAPDKSALRMTSGGLVDNTDDSAVKIKQGGTYKISLEETDSAYIMTYYENGSSENAKSYTYYKADKNSDPLRTVDTQKQYVGFAVARGCNATFSNIKFTTSEANADNWQPRPITLVEPDYQITSASTSSGAYTLVFKANATGKAVIKANPAVGGKTVLADNVEITANTAYSLPLAEKLTADTTFTVEFTPNPDYTPSDHEKLSSYETKAISHTVSYRSFPTDTALYVSAGATAAGDGTQANPVDIATAFRYAQPGQKIILAAETYKLDSGLKIERGIDGTADAPISVESSDPAKHAILDFQRKGSGLEIWGSYWNFKNIDAANSAGKGCQLSGNHNLLEQMNFYNNGNTGLQISGTSEETIALWPSDNTVKNCTSMNNADKAMEDADGFAAKLTCGTGNVFDGCIAAYNADDGWDLFAKVATGTIGDVTIKNSIAYRNGFLIVSDKSNLPEDEPKPEEDKKPEETKKPEGSKKPEENKTVSLKLSASKLTFDTIGAKKKLTASVTPADTAIQWSSSNTKVAAVSKGTVTAKGNGTATITAKAGGVTATCKVTVSQKSKQVSIQLNNQTVSGKTVTVTKGQSYKLTAAVTPSNAASKNKKITWTSSNKKLATVSNGTVKVKGSKGTVKITAITADKKKATVTFKISTKAVKVSSVKIEGKKTMKKGTRQTLKAVIAPATAKNRNVTWKSSNKKIATVSAKGVVKALKKGKVKITVVTKDGKKKHSITIQIK